MSRFDPTFRLTKEKLVPRIKYVAKKFNTASLAIISHANVIIKEYMDAGFILTLRQ